MHGRRAATGRGRELVQAHRTVPIANYLRAIELAEAKYTWVICDDDSFDSRAEY